MSDHQSTMPPPLTTRIDLLEARLAARVAASLTGSAQDLSADVCERLRFARHQALDEARRLRSQAIVGAAADGGTVWLGRLHAWWPWLGAAAPAAALVAGLALVNHWNERERVQAAAEIDAALLADQLPPAAYADPGFAAFLKLAPP